MDVSIAFDGACALRILRAARAGMLGPDAAAAVGMDAPRSFPSRPYPGAARTRFTRGLIASIALGDGFPAVASWPAGVAVPVRDARLQMAEIESAVYGETVGQEAFVTVADGIQIPAPELLYVEMARTMHPYLLTLLGCELCGTYVRNADDPRDGDVCYGVAPATTVERIRTFLDATSRLAGKVAATKSLRYVCENAWSPMEAVIAVLACMPMGELGYELAPVALNARVNVADALAGGAAHATRVPDLLIAGSHVGINYDGGGHLDLGRVVGAALAVATDPGDAATAGELDAAERTVRNRYVDDRRRDRELMANGYRVFSVTREDLSQQGGLDKVMGLVVSAIEGERGTRMEAQRSLLASGALSKVRQDLVWAVMPGKRGAQALHRLLAREAALVSNTRTQVTDVDLDLRFL